MRKPSSQATFQICSLYHQAVELIGRRWNGAIIEALMGGARRFCEIRAAVPGLKDAQLARRLRELEQQGIVERRVVPSRPVRVEYALTPKGEDLRAVVAEVHRWAQRWLTSPDRPSETGEAGAAMVPEGRGKEVVTREERRRVRMVEEVAFKKVLQAGSLKPRRRASSGP